MIGHTPLPLARAAATNSSDLTCTVADSATRTTRGMKTTESEISVFERPGPSDAGDRDGEEHGGERVEHVHRAHDRACCVSPPDVAGEHAERGAEDERHHGPA